MLKGRELRGLPVFCGSKQGELGRVQDWIVDESNGLIRALVIVGGGVWQRTYLARAENIHSLSKKGVFLQDKAFLQPLPKNLLTFSQAGWLGAKILNSHGDDRGTIADIVIDNDLSAGGILLKGIEVSTGLMGDISSGREYLPMHSVMHESGSFTESSRLI